MAVNRLRLALTLAAGLTLLPAVSWAGGRLSIMVSGGTLRVTASGAAVAPVAAGALVLGHSGEIRASRRAVFDGPTHLIVDATPLHAQVFLDGRLLGTARQVVARAFPLPPGRHAIEIVSPGFRPYVVQFTAVPGSFPIRVRVTLAP